MTEDQHKQPESESFPPQTPPIPSAAGKSSSNAFKRTNAQNNPVVKDVTIKILRGTIGLLEGVVEKLETAPVKEIPPKMASPATTSVFTPVSNTTTGMSEPKWESSGSASIMADTPTVKPEEVVSETPTVIPEVLTEEPAAASVSPPITTGLIDRLLPSFDKLQAFWDATLVKVRSLLPAEWNEKLSDWGLTGAIAGVVVIFMLTTAAILPKTPTQVAKAPPNSIDAPPELKAPEPPQPVEMEPLPLPELTPEQSLIASIQQQVTELTNRYGKGLIQSIEVNFSGSRLVVKLSDLWYDLKESQQNKLADEILLRARELDFSKLQITDLKGALIARNPVVGSNMVILKRQELAENL